MIITTCLTLAALTTQDSARTALHEPFTTLATDVASVTVHTDRARVTRRSELLAVDGMYRVEGLTGTLDPDSVRASVPGGRVLSVEVRTRRAGGPPSERLEAFQAEQAELDARRAELTDELDVLNSLAQGLARLAPTSGERSEPGDPAAWASAARFVAEQSTRDAAKRRDLELRVAEVDRLQEDLYRRRGSLAEPGGSSYEVWIEVDVPDAGAALEVEYLVPSAGWEPRYELRAASDARSVNVAYRASVHQASGEDWRGVRLALSTAQPLLGTVAPELETRWARVMDRNAVGRSMDLGLLEERDRYAEKVVVDARRLGYTEASESPSPTAVIDDLGLSLRYELPSTDTVLSGAPPASVLIDSVELAIAAEYSCVPALDTTVWLRGHATNDSRLTFLPGNAAVFFGADHLGNARLDTVRPGQEFVMHLGADPALEVTRRLIGEGTDGAGFFGSKDTWHREWSIRVANHGASIAADDGSAVVFVREALPRSTDERVSVSLEGSNQPTAAGERWQADREEHGFETWRLDVPRGGEVELRYTLQIRHPEDATLRFR